MAGPAPPAERSIDETPQTSTPPPSPAGPAVSTPLSPAITDRPAEPAAASDDEERDTPATPSQGSWLPIPIFITEPAIGIGLGAALAYFHPRAKDAGTLSTVATPQSVGGTGSGRKRPPDISGVAAGYTDNDTWAAGVGHSASWRLDRVRYVGALAYADINASLYPADRELGFNLEGTFLFQDIKLRLGSSDFFLGGKLFALDTATAFQIEAPSKGSAPISSTDEERQGRQGGRHQAVRRTD